MAEMYLSIKEFSEKANVSIQSVYKRLRKENDPLHEFIKIKDGKKVISIIAIDEIYKNGYDEYEEIDSEEIENTETEESEIIKLLKAQVEEQRKEIEFKNKQIEELNEQLKASSERETNYQTLLNQQQQLTAIANTEKQLLVDKTKKKSIIDIFRKKRNEQE